MAFIEGPKYKHRCEGTAVWTAPSGRAYCKRCGDGVEIRKDGKARTHYQIRSIITITTDTTH
jgi:hypothetical protein